MQLIYRLATRLGHATTTTQAGGSAPAMWSSWAQVLLTVTTTKEHDPLQIMARKAYISALCVLLQCNYTRLYNRTSA
jgi:hypothetical protein